MPFLWIPVMSSWSERIMVAFLKLLSYNCRRLNNPIKLKRVSNLLTKERPGVVFLQETHQKKILPRLLKSTWFDLHFQAPGSSKAREVAIVISKHVSHFIILKFSKTPGTGIYLWTVLLTTDLSPWLLYMSRTRTKFSFYQRHWLLWTPLGRGIFLLEEISTR